MSKVLIVEDELSIAELEKDYLELSSFEVEIETDGQQGLEKALKEDFDMIILDIMLPGVDANRSEKPKKFQFLWYLQEKKTSIRSED